MTWFERVARVARGVGPGAGAGDAETAEMRAKARRENRGEIIFDWFAGMLRWGTGGLEGVRDVENRMNGLQFICC